MPNFKCTEGNNYLKRGKDTEKDKIGAPRVWEEIITWGDWLGKGVNSIQEDGKSNYDEDQNWLRTGPNHIRTHSAEDDSIRDPSTAPISRAIGWRAKIMRMEMWGFFVFVDRNAKENVCADATKCETKIRSPSSDKRNIVRREWLSQKKYFDDLRVILED